MTKFNRKIKHIKAHCGSICTLVHTREIKVTWKATTKRRGYTEILNA